MSKYSEMVALLEYMNSHNRRKEPDHKFFRRKKEPDFFKQLMKFQEQKEKYEKWLKTQEKKDEKKEEKKGFLGHMSIAQKTVMFTILGPPVGITYVFVILLLAKSLAHTAGVR